MVKPPSIDDLTYTRHAQWRMHHRTITRDEVRRAICNGEQVPRGPNILHYDPQTWIGGVVNWQTRTVITVMKLCRLPPRRERDTERA